MGLFGTARFLPTAKKELRIICGTLFNSYWGTICQNFSIANPAYFPKILNRSLKKTNTISAMKNISPIM